MELVTRQSRLGLALAALLVLSAWPYAQAAETGRGPAGSGRGAGGFMAKLDRAVGLTPEQRDSVHGLFAEQRRTAQAAREQTDLKIRAVLTPDQQKKFDVFMTQQKNSRAWKPAAS